MTMIFDGLYAEAYRVAIGLRVPNRVADSSEFPGLAPILTKTLWASIAAALINFSGVLEESEFHFPSDY